ncbi:phosphoenolpyruvate--protein phosphotransferase [PVC group bacterium (ex Bugula neritina AB1)]|nr:phosphoenolpyruvate--protein phosphotransferase [PVC group bacterium (ex Bugula neritina AB1)]
MSDSTKKSIQGVPASAGFAMAKAHVIKKDSFTFSHKPINKEDVEKELERFQKAISLTREEITRIKNDVKNSIGDESASIFTVHLLVLDDPSFYKNLKSRLLKQLLNIEFIFYELLQEYSEKFSSMDDPYIKERLADIEDVGRRVLKNLTGKEESYKHMFREPCVLIAPDILPSDVVMIHMENVLGFISDAGSKTSHAAIVARSFKVPAIVGAGNASTLIKNGDFVILDAITGTCFVNPDEKTVKKYTFKLDQYTKYSNKFKKFKSLKAQTKDKHEINLMANIEIPKDIYSALDNGAEGIGLFRTEFLYMNRLDLPTEEEQYHIYKKILCVSKSKNLTVRTLDVGGDKLSPQLNIAKEENPALGLRAIRFCLDRSDIFKVQIRALLRASIHGSLKIMLPMITSLEEILKTKEILADIKKDLQEKKIPFNDNIPLGIMIETPAAAMTADILAEHVDFFSLGTNDLIQYSLAVDRGNEKMARYYDPFHPAILRFIHHVIKVAHKANIDVSLCGEISSDPLLLEILIGLGLHNLSVSHSLVPEIKHVISCIDISDAQEFAQKACDYKGSTDLAAAAKTRLKKLLQKNSEIYSKI